MPALEPFSPDPARVTEARDTIDPNLFQAYDIRGDAEPHPGRARPNFRPEDAYLIARALGTAYRAGAAGDTPASAVVASDHRPSSPVMRAAIARGFADAGMRVAVAAEPVPTGAVSRLALVEGHDIAVQVTGSHNPSYNNGMKITMKQDADGRPDPGGAPGALFGNKGKRPFELRSILEWIKRPLPVTPVPEATRNLSERHDVVRDYLAAVEKHFREAIGTPDGRFRRRFRIVHDSGNGLGALSIPLFEALGAEVKPLFAELDGRFPNHPADPSAPDGVKAAEDEVRRQNAAAMPGAGSASRERAFALVFDGDGDRFGLVDENARVVYPDRVLLATYTRFILSNLEIMRALQDAGCPTAMALDVRGSSAILDVLEHVRRLTGVEVRGQFVPAGYPSHRSFVRHQLARLRRCAVDHGLADRPTFAALTGSFTSAEASGHFFYPTARDSRWPDLVIDDGIFSAVQMLVILDTVADIEARHGFTPTAPAGSAVGFCDLFALFPSYVTSNEVRGAAPLDDARKFAIVEEIESGIRAGKIAFSAPTASIIGMDQIDDGCRITFQDQSFLLIRASNTSPKFTYKFEARSRSRLLDLIDDAIRIVSKYRGDGVSSDELVRERAVQEGVDAGVPGTRA